MSVLHVQFFQDQRSKDLRSKVNKEKKKNTLFRNGRNSSFIGYSAGAFRHRRGPGTANITHHRIWKKTEKNRIRKSNDQQKKNSWSKKKYTWFKYCLQYLSGAAMPVVWQWITGARSTWPLPFHSKKNTFSKKKLPELVELHCGVAKVYGSLIGPCPEIKLDLFWFLTRNVSL